MHLTARPTAVTNNIALMYMTPFDADLRPEHLTSQNVCVVLKLFCNKGLTEGSLHASFLYPVCSVDCVQSIANVLCGWTDWAYGGVIL